MGLAQRMKKGLTSMIPSTKVVYKAPAEKNQSTLSDAQYRKLKNKISSNPTVKQYGDKGYTPVSKNVTKK